METRAAHDDDQQAGRPRAITGADLGGLGQLLDGVFRLPRGIVDQHVLTDFPRVFVPSNFGNSRVIEVEGRIVSHAAIWPREFLVGAQRVKVAMIAVVATWPEHRQRGYAATLMRDLQRTIREEEYDLGLLWTGVPEFYRKLGWEIHVPRGWRVEVPAHVPAPRLPAGTSIERYDGSRHLEGIIRLHERETIRIARNADEWRTLLTLPKIVVWLITGQDEVLAYLVHSTAVNKPGIIEYAGETDLLAALILHEARSFQDDKVVAEAASLSEPPTLAASATANGSSGGETRLLVYPPRADLMEWSRSQGFPITPLSSSKGIGDEMIFVNCHEQVATAIRRDLFTWGLDQA